MALKHLGARTRTLANRVGYGDGEAAVEARRAKREPWRAWYKSAEWRRLRREAFARDGYTCQQTGELLVGKHPAANSPVADHIKPHRGNRELFFDLANIQTVSKAYHDGQKQSLEKAGRA